MRRMRRRHHRNTLRSVQAAKRFIACRHSGFPGMAVFHSECRMHKKQISEWIVADPLRMRALDMARALALPDWCLAAGFVRNLVWDKLHRFATPTVMNDIDLIYFDAERTDPQRDRDIEAMLRQHAPDLPWSVRNQARMHERNGDAPYGSTLDAMRYWVEVETAVGVRLLGDGELEILAPFDLDSLFAKNITPNPRRYKPADFGARLSKKNWLWIWPELQVNLGAEAESRLPSKCKQP
jgi:uncharacterized protein